jgi:SAM-dependent methyltransferase
MNRLEIFASPTQEQEMLEAYLRAKASETPPPLRILEAGCGRRWPLRLKDFAYTLTGIDVDEAALEIRKSIHNDLHEVVVGDLRTARFDDGAFDVIFNSFVLEHIQDAQRVLENFVRWLRPGGLLILRIPDRDSVYGFVARMTPHWFHVVFARHISGWKWAGKPGCGPYPTVYDPVVSRRGIHEFAARRGLAIREEYGHAIALKNAKPPRTLLVNSVVGMLGALSLGRLASDHSNLTYVLEKAPVREEAPVA